MTERAPRYTSYPAAPHFHERGNIAYDGSVLSIAPQAQNHLRLIASVFDSYLFAANHRYSQAV